MLLIEITKNITKNELFLYRYSRNISQILTPLRMGIFGATHGWEGGIERHSPSLPKICRRYHTMMKLGTVIPYPKKDSENIWITLHTPWYIISIFFNFFWVFEECFNKNSYSFDDFSKNGYSKPSGEKGILKKRLWHHNFRPWRQQQNFITCTQIIL